MFATEKVLFIKCKIKYIFNLLKKRKKFFLISRKIRKIKSRSLTINITQRHSNRLKSANY